jgi:hypothetical protein
MVKASFESVFGLPNKFKIDRKEAVPYHWLHAELLPFVSMLHVLLY